MRRDYAVEADSLKPYIVPWIAAAVAAGGPSAGSGVGGALTAHELNGPYHLGTLNRSQAPWVATDIASAIASHAALPDAHHARQHSITSSDDHSITGAALSLVGATATNTLGLITPSANPGTTESVLKATAGLLTLPNFTATTAIRTPVIDTASGNLTLQPTGNFVKLAANRGIESAGTFVSGFTGAGLRIDDGITKAGKTSIEADNLTVRGTMRVYELVIQQIRMTNGSLLVSSTAKVKSVSGSGPYTIVTDGQHGLAVNDLILAQRWNPTQGALTGLYIYRSAMRVTSITTAGTDWQFTAVLLEGDPPVDGAEFGRAGNTTDTSRQGGIYLTSDDTHAPYIDIYNDVSSMALWTGAAKLKVRLGRLSGIGDAVLNPTGYGLYSNNVYLKGVLSAANNNVLINDDGVRVRAVALEPLADINAYTIETAAGVTMGGLYGRHFANNYDLFVQAQGDNSNDAWLTMRALGTAANGDANVILYAANSSSPSKEASIWLDVDGTSSLIRMTGAQYVRFEVPTQSFAAHEPFLDLGPNLGGVSKRWNTLYVGQIIATTISGATMAGATWQYSGNMVIDANSASDTVVNVVNNGAGAVIFDVLGQIRQSGANVSLVGHTHDDRYFTEAESDARYVQTATLSNYVLRAGDTMTGALLMPNGTASAPALAFSSDTDNGIYRAGADILGVSKALQASAIRNTMIAFGGQGANDLSMIGVFYDRNELALADARGTVTITLTGAGSVTTSTVGSAFDSRGGYLTITGTDSTTTQIVIQIDLGALTPNYGSQLWQPYLQYRLAWANTSGTKYRNIVCEVSSNGTTWAKPATGWETTDASAAEPVAGLWVGVNGAPGFTWRYARFTLTDRAAGVTNADQVWISAIGLRHYSAPATRSLVSARGDTVYGPLVVRTGNAAAFDVQTSAGVSVFKVNTTALTATLAGDLSVADLFVGDGLATLPAVAFALDLDSGIYRSAANTWHLVAGGTAVQSVTTAGISVTGTVAASGGLTAPSLTTASGNLSIGSVGGTVAFGGQILTGTNWSVAASGAASFAPATDTAHDLGLARIGFMSGASDHAVFAHRSHATLTNFALLHSPLGDTIINGATAVGLWVNGSTMLTLNSARGLPAGSGLKDWGDYNRRWRTIHAEELAVQTLVAQNVIATIGGDIIVTPTTKLIADIVSTAGGIGQSALYTTLVAYWKLNEGSGDRYDSKGSNTLTSVGGVGMSATGKQENAATFTKASSQRLNAADNSALSVGDIDFYVACWVYGTLDDGTSQYIAAKAGSSGNRAWYLYFDWATNQIKFRAFDSSDNSTTVTASTFGTVTTATWYFVEAWHNAATNQIGVAVNGVSNTSSHTTGVRDDTGPFQIGAANSGSHFDGWVDEFGYWKNYIPNSTERTWLYNAGVGRTLEQMYVYGVTDINLDVEHNNLRSGEWIILKTAPGGIQQTEKMLVTSGYTPVTVGGKSGYRYTASRDQDGTGPNNWYIGDAVASQQKNVGEGHLWLTATTTVHGHTGPALIGYVRTGPLVNDIKPVFAKGNLRSFVDYTTDEYGDAAGNDLTLLPNTGFAGYTIDRTAGLRLFNANLALFSGLNKIIGLDTTRGLDIEIDTVDGDSNRAISYRSSGATYNWLKAYNTGGWQYLKMAAEPIAGLNNSVILRTSAAASQESSIFLSTTNAAGNVVSNYVYLHHKTDGTGEMELSSATVTVFGAVMLTGAVGTQLTVNGASYLNGGLAVGQNYSPSWGGISAGSIGVDYTPTIHNWYTSGSTLLLNGSNYTTIGFHDSLNRVDFIRVGAGLITLGYDGGFGAANVEVVGNMGVGLASPSYRLDVNGAAHASSFPTSSDARLKTGLAPISGVLGRMGRIQPYNFYWRQGYHAYDQFLDGEGRPQLQIGFLAQEVEAEFPEVISRWRHGGNIPLDDARAVDYARLVPVLWSAVQELHAEVLELRERLSLN